MQSPDSDQRNSHTCCHATILHMLRSYWTDESRKRRTPAVRGYQARVKPPTLRSCCYETTLMTPFARRPLLLLLR